MSYVTGKMIKELREKKSLTQKQLADQLQISDKAVSKWETDRGLPDIGLISNLAEALGVSVAELLLGEVTENQNRSANMKKMQFYICPVCGNVIQAIGNGSYSCCGIMLPAAEVEDNSKDHLLQVEVIDNEYYVHMEHPMAKDHYVSFIAYVTSNRSELIKLYPEQNIECRFAKRGHGYFYAYCNKDGLYRFNI
ncbi:helix-turn-helix domain-containing protein [Anaeromicropila herbilytica]|uniref:XRE family transcriptional regulator n=1 Tax=Anaeromicropila herbilytica TaxID=2785025 RepID=A0A7R7ELW3_9FIRM|nr:helix-turn-helix domain-containing protein [Anaeromicropila herbilytica]BCN31021.1 XRE family transcriptional regulator [Anaeromicropila herbilytica]